ncbi:hypothetical protein RND71_041048 [Anisodus tanguticus]|uniref:Uncharacterized protein n=1 Tax=Anisodus tanguticus TaxID=243964 RepID=A0AAE1QUH5_9SOLA|nr:hypothetical protein RND71_041048 [Anisodus tanguticus]
MFEAGSPDLKHKFKQGNKVPTQGHYMLISMVEYQEKNVGLSHTLQVIPKGLDDLPGSNCFAFSDFTSESGNFAGVYYDGDKILSSDVWAPDCECEADVCFDGNSMLNKIFHFVSGNASWDKAQLKRSKAQLLNGRAAEM